MENKRLSKLVKELLDLESGKILEKGEIIQMLLEKPTVHKNEVKLTLGQRVADKMADVAGSWGFIISFCAVLIFWIILNIVILSRPFDAYPFILLNLVLSMLAAIQAPIIMMSQNRQETKDRQRAENDYKINLKAEIILEDIHAKIVALTKQQQHLSKKIEEIERMQKKNSISNNTNQ
ncbi:MAG: DUF1003 domain-containing protein [Eubacteriaceae bacterium]